MQVRFHERVAPSSSHSVREGPASRPDALDSGLPALNAVLSVPIVLAALLKGLLSRTVFSELCLVFSSGVVLSVGEVGQKRMPLSLVMMSQPWGLRGEGG